tara:strand:+ start:278 stop:502 length:225 start_codon:yes stop_codon:yes gene_type:complete
MTSKSKSKSKCKCGECTRCQLKLKLKTAIASQNTAQKHKMETNAKPITKGSVSQHTIAIESDGRGGVDSHNIGK